MPYAVMLTAPGGTDALAWREVPVPAPGPGEVLIRQAAVGVNFLDIYYRSGLYALPHYPHGIGTEGVGVVEALGGEAGDFAVGERVAYARSAPGAYAQYRALPQAQCVRVPDSIDDTTAAAVLLKGLTASYLLHHSYALKAGDVAVVHAAAGGVGQLLSRWANHLGATVIGTAGGAEKCAIAIAAGCAYTVDYTHEKPSERVRTLTAGKGAEVVYDSVGQATFMDSLDCLKPFGTLVSFGQSSGKVPPFDISLLSQKGSLFLTRPTLFHHAQNVEWYRRAAAELFALIGQGILKAAVDRVLPLRDFAEAHRALEARETRGSVILLP